MKIKHGLLQAHEPEPLKKNFIRNSHHSDLEWDWPRSRCSCSELYPPQWRFLNVVLLISQIDNLLISQRCPAHFSMLSCLFLHYVLPISQICPAHFSQLSS